MKVQSARHGKFCLHLRIDGYGFTTMDKYTILEMGYTMLLPKSDVSRDWILEHGETIPPDPEDNRGPLHSGGMVITSDPVVVSLSYADWWARNSEGFKAGRPLRIPSRDEAIGIVRNRKILNDFKRKYEGKLPCEWLREGIL